MRALLFKTQYEHHDSSPTSQVNHEPDQLSENWAFSHSRTTIANNNYTDQWSSGWASATEAVDSGSIPGRVKPKTIKIGIHSFPAWRSALKGTVWSFHRVW